MIAVELSVVQSNFILYGTSGNTEHSLDMLSAELDHHLVCLMSLCLSSCHPDAEKLFTFDLYIHISKELIKILTWHLKVNTVHIQLKGQQRYMVQCYKISERSEKRHKWQKIRM